MNIVNTTPHPIRFQDVGGRVYEIEPCGVIINAKIEEELVYSNHGVEMVTTRFVPDEKSAKELAGLETANPGSIIVGSIIAAKAYPERICALVPVKGFERVPPEQKRMRDDKFTVFKEDHIRDRVGLVRDLKDLFDRVVAYPEPCSAGSETGDIMQRVCINLGLSNYEKRAVTPYFMTRMGRGL